MESIREYEPADRAQYLALIDRVFGEYAPHNDPAKTLDRVLGVASSVVVLAEVDGALVGAVTGGYDGTRGWLYSVAVDPNHRRAGVGTRLVEAVEEKLHRLGCPKINLQVRAENSAVADFYKSLGYEAEPRISMGKRLPV